MVIVLFVLCALASLKELASWHYRKPACIGKPCEHDILVNMRAANGPFNAPTIPNCSVSMNF